MNTEQRIYRLEKMVQYLRCNNNGGGGTSIHNNLQGLQGGQPGQYYHLTQEQYDSLGGGGVVVETDPTVPQHVKNITQNDIDYWNSVGVAQIKLTTTTGFTTLTAESGSNLPQNGKNVLIDNGTNNITITTDINSPATFIATYIKLGTGTVSFVAGAGTTLQLVDGTNTLGNIGYQRCALVRNGNEFILYISYA